ncbi:uncharacterized protein LOC129592558 [Paramacrobiotus metropolitanus]|uniref:uncharacterized protein LOC129592558 n=1 Tax=Paramacrobiotus metropolitanus TaxID=2943436 RepID=UPI00244633BE|nr:uncharacterized protein LOC129592558 [Paramacrobiotus metropolitanus]
MTVDLHTLPEPMFLSQAVTPIAKQIISFALYNCHKIACTTKLAALELSNLLSFTLNGCSNSAHPRLRREDFAPSPHLRSIVITDCAPYDLDAFTFTNLPDLQVLALENQLTACSNTSSNAALAHLRNLHCGCQYAWLRDLFTAKPGLLAERPENSVYQVCNAGNPAFKKVDLCISCERSKELKGPNQN